MSGDLDIAISNDWWDAGWQLILPRQAFPLHMLVASATVHELEGGLDTLLRVLLGGEWDMLLGGLDAPVAWTWPTRTPGEEPPDAEQLALDAAAKERFETAMVVAGRPIPRTVRELAALMVDLGVFTLEVTNAGERWRSPTQLSLPGEMLPFPADFVDDLDASRWRSAAEPYAQRLIRHVADELGSPDEVSTTVERLSRATGLAADAVRHGLTALVSDGDFRVVRDTADHNPETLADHARFQLVPDWAAFAESRITIRRRDWAEGS